MIRPDRYEPLSVVLVIVVVLIWSGTGYTRLVSGREPDKPTVSMLLTNNRTQLNVCVHSLVPGMDNEETRGLVESALAQVRKHPNFKAARLDAADPAVDAGCPAPAQLGSPNWDAKLGAAPIVTTASSYRLFVFVADVEQLSIAFGGRVPRTTAQEILCEGEQCSEVTTALYVTPSELRNQAASIDALTHGVGLLPPNVDESQPPAGAQK